MQSTYIILLEKKLSYFHAPVSMFSFSLDYSPPPGVFHFLLSFSVAEVAAIAEYLGYRSEEVGPVFHQDRGSKEQQVCE